MLIGIGFNELSRNRSFEEKLGWSEKNGTTVPSCSQSQNKQSAGYGVKVFGNVYVYNLLLPKGKLTG